MTVERYIAYIRDVRRYSPRTQELYRKALEDFEAWGGDLIPSRLREYEAHLMERGLKPRTVHLHMSALSGYCNFLMKEGVLSSNPVRGIKRPKMEKRLPEYYTEKSLAEYLEASAHGAGKEELEVLESLKPGEKLADELYNRRLRRLIVSLLYATGIRRAELIGLQLRSVDSARQTLRVRGKGDKMREIPLIPSVLEEISLYLQAVKSMELDCTPESPLLRTVKGKPLYPAFVDRAVKTELQGQDGITGENGTGRLRHHREEIPPRAQALAGYGPFGRRSRPERHQADAGPFLSRSHGGVHPQFRRKA